MADNPPVKVCDPDPRLANWPYAPEGHEEKWSPHRMFYGMPPPDKVTWSQIGFAGKPEREPGKKCSHFFVLLKDKSGWKCRFCGMLTNAAGRKRAPKRMP